MITLSVADVQKLFLWEQHSVARFFTQTISYREGISSFIISYLTFPFILISERDSQRANRSSVSNRQAAEPGRHGAHGRGVRRAGVRRAQPAAPAGQAVPGAQVCADM